MHWLIIAHALTREAAASGYHPDFDQAVREATAIALCEVRAALPATDILVGIPDDLRRYPGQVYDARITRSFAGPLADGEALWIWDALAGSTARQAVNMDAPNLTFLAPPGANRHGNRQTYGGGGATSDGRPVMVVFRNLSEGPDTGLDGWLTLLEWTDVGARPLSLEQARAAVADLNANAELHRYALSHWPTPLTPEDAATISALITARIDDARVVHPASALLREHGHGLSGDALRKTLEAASPYARSGLVRDVNAGNIAQVRDVLWSWVETDAAGALEALDPLAAHAGPWLTEKLRQPLPFWLDIPATLALGLEPADFGRSYPVLEENRWLLVGPGDLVKGKTFGARMAMDRRDESFGRLLPLVAPHLPQMTAEARETAIAAMRTFGYAVERSGDAVTLGPRRDMPVRARLEILTATRVKLVLSADPGIVVCDRIQHKVELTAGDQTTSIDRTWNDFGAPPRSCFVARDGDFYREEIDVSALLENLSDPTDIKVSVSALLGVSGAEQGFDAWTGMVSTPATPLGGSR